MEAEPARPEMVCSRAHDIASPLDGLLKLSHTLRDTVIAKGDKTPLGRHSHGLVAVSARKILLFGGRDGASTEAKNSDMVENLRSTHLIVV